MSSQNPTRFNRTLAAAIPLAASTLAGFSSIASSAELYGGGATLPAPYVRQAGDCWGNKNNLLTRIDTGLPLGSDTIADFNYTGAPPFDCSSQQIANNSATHYISTGSGRGIEGFISHEPNRFLTGATYPSGVTPFVGVQFAHSDAPLSQTAIDAYKNGGTNVQGVVDLRAPGVADDPNNADDYGNPNQLYGSLIQIPFVVAGVAIAFDPIYKTTKSSTGKVTSYSFNLQNNGALRLDRPTYCKIFNGTITSWTDPALTALNGGVSLKSASDPAATVPMIIVGRNDNSGTTSLWTRNLAKVCGDLKTAGTIPVNYYNNAAQNLGNAVTDVNVTLRQQASVLNDEYANGNEGVALLLDTDTPANGQTVLNGRIGYLGPDFLAKYAPTGSDAKAYGLVGANVQNATGAYIAIAPNALTAAFVGQLPPQSNSKGKYIAGAPGKRSNPADWVAKADKSSPLADPSGAAAYPIVGTSNLLLYTCYSSPFERDALVATANSTGTVERGYLNWYYGTTPTITDRAKGLLGKVGFAPLPSAYSTAIFNTFVVDTNNLKLNINSVGTGNCTTAGLVGG